MRYGESSLLLSCAVAYLHFYLLLTLLKYKVVHSLKCEYICLFRNPFIWGWYRVYLPNNIETSFKGACFDFKNHGRNKTPLCLSEENWNELSSGKLSSNNVDDVNQVLAGLDYLKNTSRGIVIAALARNIADSIPSLRQNMEGLAILFKHSKNKLTLAIYENDSNDGTREAFQRWSDEVSIREDSHYTLDLMSCGPSSPDCKLGFVDRYDTFTVSDRRASGVGKLGKFRQVRRLSLQLF